MTRQSLLAILVALCTVTAFVAPAAALSLGDDDPPTPDLQTYDGNPSFIVSYEAGETAPTALQDWANASGDRQLIDLRNDSGTAVVAAPRSQIRPRTVFGISLPTPFSTLLSERSYVERIDPNYLLDVDPVTSPLTAGEFDPPKQGLFAFDDPEFPTEGLAFDGDVNASDLSVSRDATGASNVSATGSGITIAAIDTGTNTADGQLFGNGSVGSSIRIDNASKSFITGESVNATAGDFDAIADGDGHGTWVSAAIAANASTDALDGMAPDSDLLVLKALADDGSGSTADIAAAIRYAADQDVDLISMSLGSPLWSQPLTDAIDYAHEQGVSAVVVAAGNSRATRSPGIASPGDYAPVITVGATNGSAPGSAWSAYFSQTGPDTGATDASDLESRSADVDVVAPGFKITAKTASTEGFLSNSTLSGTSMGAPIVTGNLALALAANSTLAGWNHSRVHAAVLATARFVPNAAAVEAGAGMIAGDNLADGTVPETSQAEAMTAAAEQRDAYYRAFEPEGWLGGLGS